MNRLQYETSPYLRQHQHNPVDWYPWGEAALAKAKAENKPILLSIGYAACHWCHVMEHESFEDPETAAMMNDLFVNIKVDREERPDIDDLYMQATLIFTQGHGGWPMTVFLTPDGKPFHAGTYFPPTPRYGMPSFRQIMGAAHQAYINRREELEASANQITQLLNQSFEAYPATSNVNADLLRVAASKLIADADPLYGGLHRGQPKFPSPMNLDFLLHYHTTHPDERFIKTVSFTLRKMAQGGIYDQIGGGFHRYSVDNRWLVPHFEKMLYDNAQLARLYLHAYQLTGDTFFADICRDILAYIEREMLDPCGGFYSTQDADSEGEEGKFYVWTCHEIQEALQGHLSETEIAVFLDLYDITEAGNFEGHNIPNQPDEPSVVAARYQLSIEQLQQIVQTARPLLFAYREQRIKPGLDDKLLAAWNGMMLAAYAEAARVFDDTHYQRIAERNAAFILNELSMVDGRLYRTHKRQANGIGESKLAAYLEDYANVIDGLLELYQTSFEPRWFSEAQRLADYVLAHFKAEAGFYDTSDEHETLIARPRSLQDNATPAGNTLMALGLLKLAAYTGNATYEDAAISVYGQIDHAMREYPSAFGIGLAGVHLLTQRPIEVAVIGEHNASKPILDIIQKTFRPRVLIAFAETDQDEAAVPPLLAYRNQRDGQPTIYVCQNFVCAAPVHTTTEVDMLLDKV